jgi:hypothetical protein
MAACGGKSGPALPEAQAFPEPGAPQKTVVVEKGSEGRVLRFSPKAGDSDKVRAKVDLKTSVEGGGQSMDIEMGMEMTLANEIAETKGDGSFQMKASLEDVKATLGGDMASMGVDPSIISDAMKGLITNVSVDPRGRILDMALAGDNPFADQMKMGLDQSFQTGFIPLPEEAVGPGAVWDALGHMDSMGVKARLSARYTLVSLEGSRAVVEISMRGVADKQKARFPNAPIDVDLESLEIEGGGKMSIDLERPTRGDMNLDLTLKASMSAEGESVSMKLAMKMTANAL